MPGSFARRAAGRARSPSGRSRALSSTLSHSGIGSQKARGRKAMLGDHPIHPVLLAKDLAAAREFYHDRIGLEILMENDDAIVFRCGNGTQLDVTKSTVGTADEQTQVSWEVPDLRAEVDELR